MSDVLQERFAHFTSSAVRLEVHPAYSVSGEAERIAAWLAGNARPERSVRTNRYLQQVARDVLAGKHRTRARVVDHPLPQYIRYQLTGYIESQAAGEEIRVAVRAGGSDDAQRELATLTTDFWLFDQNLPDACAVFLDYDAHGRYTGCRAATPAELETCRQAWAIASRHAIPLNEYLAGGHGATAVA